MGRIDRFPTVNILTGRVGFAERLTLDCAPGLILSPMRECCNRSAEPRQGPVCSVCGSPGRPVDQLTVKALLTTAALTRFEPGEYRLCAAFACPMVYFDAHGRTFSAADIRVAVYAKEPVGERTICYCFGENERGIRDDFASRGMSRAVERVREHIAARRCACEVRHPRGSCCLADVIAAVARARIAFGSPAKEP
jgi:hypothetical protein